MRYFPTIDDSLDLFKALGSDLRITILNLLLEEGSMSMNELATKLNITNGALTGHIKKLEDCNLIRISSEGEHHGNQKICTPHLEQMLFVFAPDVIGKNESLATLRVGQYSSFEIYPTCGISTSQSIIGDVDDPRFFIHQEHYNADILWFGKGFVEYIIPNVLPIGQKVEELSISMELSSEAPGSNDIWPSDIHFYLNNELIGIWTSPGDFADTKGLFTPDWWFPTWNQYGLLKTLTLNKKGTFMDNVKISNTSMQQFSFTDQDIIKFKIAVPSSARHIGGVTLFGKTFGNYNQDIKFKIKYSPLLKE